jgi:hypothetical protein
MFGKSRKSLAQSKRAAHNFQFRAPILQTQNVRRTQDFQSSAFQISRKWAAPVLSLLALLISYQALRLFPTFANIKGRAQYQLLGIDEKLMPPNFQLDQTGFVLPDNSIDLAALRKLLLAESFIITEASNRDLTIQVTHPQPALISNCRPNSFLSSQGSYFETSPEIFAKLVDARLPAIVSAMHQRFCDDISQGQKQTELSAIARAIVDFSQLGYHIQRVELDSGRGVSFESEQPSIRFAMSIQNMGKEIETLRWLKSRSKITSDVTHVELDVAGKAFLRRKPRI